MSSKHILLIDDEKYLSLVIQTCLVKLGGWSVSIAESRQDGLLKAETELPDAILLDIMMADLDGWKVLEHLRANPKTEKIPVILLTVTSNPVVKSDSEQLQVAGILAKPFEPLQLVPQIATLLNWDYKPRLNISPP
ncbi:response regulator [Leptolyngbya sp. GGD]|uniref:response regulator n=1 Tax=Leptolyngbya sp. GGD TaxID=2997907 RepID=UPI00227BC373|nr:response regulator [Leptolyngbya sp. GGD]MCY6491182.1 response regulator [Leptolyngbya sp. GGD]